MSQPQGTPQASLNPPSLGQYGGWTRSQVYYPEVLIPGREFAGVQPRDYVVNLSAGTANIEVLRPISVDIPGTVYAMTGGSRDTTGTAFPVGLESLDTFKIRIEHNSNDRFVTQTAYGSAVVGTAARPRLVGASGWIWDRGGTIRVFITPLRANLDIDISLWVIEYRGLQNFTMR